MGVADDLVPVLKSLRLSGVLHTLDLRTQQAVDDTLSHTEFLYRLLHDEMERRDAKRLELRLKKADFEAFKSLEDYDFTFNPEQPKSLLLELGNGSFVDRKENVLLIGPAGVGKSHMAQALGHRACRQGKRVRYVSAHQLLTELRASRADQSWEKVMSKLETLDLLIIDDLGLRPFANDEPHDFYELIRRRYEHGSLMLTSNRDVDEWYALFGDALLATSAMDRLLHHCHVVHMTGKSFRKPTRRKDQ